MSDSELECEKCGNTVDIERCNECGHYYCTACLTKCEECGEYVCADCIVSCNTCDSSICKSCSRKCSDCGRINCNQCITSCLSCGDDVCEYCSYQCDECGNLFCSSCIDQCHECETNVCSGCRGTCSCEHTLCSNCICEDCNNSTVDLDEYEHTHILNYERDADWKFVKQPWENTTFLGIELEMSFPQDLTKKILNITKQKLNGLCFWKADSSINDGDSAIGPGGELVVTPHTYLSHRKLNWNEILKEFVKAGAISYDAGTCGLHIHTNLDNLSRKDLRKLKAFLHHNRGFIEKFSKRSQESLARYAEIPDNLKMWIDNDYSWERNSCINRTEHTLEFRLFRGTLNHTSFRACLQFVESIIDFVKTHSFAACKNDNAIKYFKEHNKKRFILLNKYIESIGY